MAASNSVDKNEHVKPWHEPPFDQDGRPTSDESFYVFRFFFENRGRGFTPQDVAIQLCISSDLVTVLCHQYLAATILTTDTNDPYLLRYDLNSRNAEVQGRLEASVLDYWQTRKSVTDPGGSRSR